MKTRKYTKPFSLKISENEYQILEKKSKIAKMNKSEFIRKVAIHSAVEIKPIDKVFQKKVLFLLSNATNNINQIARNCNIKKEVDIDTLQELKIISSYFKSVVSSQL